MLWRTYYGVISEHKQFMIANNAVNNAEHDQVEQGAASNFLLVYYWDALHTCKWVKRGG